MDARLKSSAASQFMERRIAILRIALTDQLKGFYNLGREINFPSSIFKVRFSLLPKGVTKIILYFSYFASAIRCTKVIILYFMKINKSRNYKHLFPIQTIRTIFILFILFGCTNSNNRSQLEITDKGKPDLVAFRVNPNLAKHLKFSEFFINPKYVKLETKDVSNLIGEVDNIFFGDENIYIRSGAKVFCFSETGKLINMVNFFGAGPGECSSPLGLYIDENKNSFSVLANDKRSLIKYTLSGEFIDEVRFPGYGFNFTQTPSEDVLLFIGNERSIFNKQEEAKLIIKYSKEGKFLDGYIDKSEFHPKNLNKLGNNDFCSSNEGRLYYKFPLFDTIYEYANDELTPRFLIDFGEHQLPTEYLYLNHSGKALSEIARIEKLAYRASNFIDSDNFYYFDFIYGEHGKRTMHFYHKETGQVYLFNQITNDFIAESNTHHIEYNQRPIGSRSGTLIFLLEPHALLRNIRALKKATSSLEFQRFVNENKNLFKLLETIKEDDNPIILFLEPKFIENVE